MRDLGSWFQANTPDGVRFKGIGYDGETISVRFEFLEDVEDGTDKDEE